MDKMTLNLFEEVELSQAGREELCSGAVVLRGFAGIGRVNDSRLPIPGDLIYAQYPRLGATRALISRVFYSPDFRALNLTEEINAARKALDRWYLSDTKEQTAALTSLRTKVHAWSV